MTTRPSHSTSSMAADSVQLLPGMHASPGSARIKPFKQASKKREDALLVGVLSAGVLLLLAVSMAL